MAIRFDAGTDRITGPGVSGSVVTVLLWLYRSVDRNASSNPLTLLTGGSPKLGIGSNSGGDFITAYDAAFNDFGNVIFAPVGGWVRFAVVANGTSWTVYHGANTGALSSTSGTRVAISSPDTLHLSASTDFWNGRLANLKVYERALDASEVAAELGVYRPISFTNLVRAHSFLLDPVAADFGTPGTDLTAGATSTSIEEGPIELASVGAMAGSAPSAVGALTGTVSPPPVTGVFAASVASAVGALKGVRRPVILHPGLRAGTPVKDPGLRAGTPRTVTSLVTVRRWTPPE
jgi:hypothetical protein